jgi:cytosine/adenosine deaminase-related metal-dependent hydrolase
MSQMPCSQSMQQAAVTFAGHASQRPELADESIDLRPLVLMPGMVDLPRAPPQLPNAGLGAGMDLLAWLERYIFPLERGVRRPRPPSASRRGLARLRGRWHHDGPRVWRRVRGQPRRHVPAAEAHGIRAIVGKVMMDRGTYDATIDPSTILDRTLAESARLIERWHGADDGRLRYAVTPRFAVTCTAELLRESAALAASTGAYWQTHVSEDQGEIAESHGCSPTRSITSMCTTVPAASASGRCWPTRSTYRIGSCRAWSGRGRASPTARSRTCSSRRA